MDKKTLVNEDIDAGQKLVRELESVGLPIASAMWLKLQEDDEWHLYISTPDVEKHGPLAVYDVIDKVIRKRKVGYISIDNISAANTSNHFINSVSRAMHVTNGIVTITNCTFDNVHVDQAVVYKITRTAHPSKGPLKLKAATKTGREHV